MNYEEILKSRNWVNNISASYFNSLAPTVFVFKLDKKATKLNPIYNEEINGRKYLRPFEIKSIYKTNPFEFTINSIPSETDGNLEFYFNFDGMVQTLHSLKTNISNFRINVVPENNIITAWYIVKSNKELKLYKSGAIDEYYINLEEHPSLSDLKTYLDGTGKFNCSFDSDDLSLCIPDFAETKFSSELLLSTFNKEFENVGDTIDQGDLIFIPTTMALYEVNAAFPSNNSMYQYINWKCTASRTFAYVEYEKLKTYQYGYKKDTPTKPSNF